MYSDIYTWHPLYNYIFEVKMKYKQEVLEQYLNKTINYDEYIMNSIYCNNLNYMLNFFREHKTNDIKPDIEALLKIFEPLDITCYKGMALLKYKSYIALNDLGENEKDFWELHDGLYRKCRSIVFDLENDAIVLAPQDKFHNVNENEKWSEKSIREKMKTAKKIEITNKLDGSNQNYRYYQGEIVGSGSSALDPTQSWRLEAGYSLLDENYKKMLKDYKDYTFMFEYISPKNPVVVKYSQEQEGLYLFGARNVYTGYEVTYEDVLKLGHKYGVKTTEIYNDSFDDILNKLDDYTSNEKEGWVIGIVNQNNNIFKAKLKVNDYVLMHKAITKMVSPNAIIEAIANDKYDDFYAKIPDAYKELAKETAMIVFNYLKKIEEQETKYYYEALNNSKDKKSFMIYCNNNVPKKYRGFVINRYLGNDNHYLTKGKSKECIGYKKISELIL